MALLCAAYAQIDCLAETTPVADAIPAFGAEVDCGAAGAHGDCARGADSGAAMGMAISAELPLLAQASGSNVRAELAADRTQVVAGLWEVVHGGDPAAISLTWPEDIWARLGLMGNAAAGTSFTVIDFTAAGMLEALASGGAAALDRTRNPLALQYVMAGWVIVFGGLIGLLLLWQRARSRERKLYRYGARPGSNGRARARDLPLAPSPSPLSSAVAVVDTPQEGPPTAHDRGAPTTLDVVQASQELAAVLRAQAAALDPEPEGTSRGSGSRRSSKRGRSRRKLHKRFSYSEV